MSSFSMEEFLGEGVLKGLIPKLVAGGWDDVPTIKMMNSEDMDWIKLTQQQKVFILAPNLYSCAIDLIDSSNKDYYTPHSFFLFFVSSLLLMYVDICEIVLIAFLE